MTETYYQTLPKKRMGAGALFLNEQGEILIVKPTYKDHWSIPGGVVDENESPRAACVREINEELGLAVPSLNLLCVDYRTMTTDRDECLQFIFSGGILTTEQIAAIKLPPDELSEFKFINTTEAAPLLSDGLRQRIPLCLDALRINSCVYLEDSKIVER
jgi:8-oxo-dGTP diphosphatase